MNYTQIPDDILPKVRTWSAMQLAVWADVHTMGKAGLDYYRTNEQLAERFATDDRTVRRVVSQLIACGAITAEQDGKLVIASHHDLKSVEALFDQILLLNGELVVCGPTAEAFTPENLDRAYGTHIFSGSAHHHHDHA